MALTKYDIEDLKRFGLNESEIETLSGILEKMTIPKEDEDAFWHTMEDEDSIPFEGGMGFSEALTGLLLEFNREE